MKHHATFYLSQDTLDLLEGAWIEVRVKAKSPKLNKSVMVEIAIRHLCDNIRFNGLADELANSIKIKEQQCNGSII